MSAKEDLRKCSVCENSLSYFPIFQTSDNQTICGRCPVLPIKTACTRDLSYEEEVEDKFFSCRYERYGCKEKLLPRHVPQHEDICLHKIITCPTTSFSMCPWRGIPGALVNHCEMDHPDYFHEDNKYELHFNKLYGCYSFAKYDDEIFLTESKLVRNGEQKVLLLSTTFCGQERNLDKYVCSAVCASAAAKLEVIFYPSSVKNLKTGEKTEIDLQSVATEDKIAVQVKIFDKKLLSTATISSDKLLAELECQICCNFMTPPIFLCFSGHSVCRICKVNVNGLCPFCRTLVTNVRNHALEKIASLPMHSCQFAGCSFTDNYAAVESHKMFCIYSDEALEYCPFIVHFGCNKIDFRRNLLHHMVRDHRGCFFDSNIVEIKSSSLVSGRQSLFIIKYFDRLFVLKLQFNRLRACVSMHLNAPPEEVRQFKYEISVLHGKILLMKSSGLSLGENNEMTIMLDFLQHEIMYRGGVTFKIHVRK